MDLQSEQMPGDASQLLCQRESRRQRHLPALTTGTESGPRRLQDRPDSASVPILGADLGALLVMAFCAQKALIAESIQYM